MTEIDQKYASNLCSIFRLVNKISILRVTIDLFGDNMKVLESLFKIDEFV